MKGFFGRMEPSSRLRCLGRYGKRPGVAIVLGSIVVSRLLQGACKRAVAEADFPVMSNKTVLISGAGIAGPTLAFWLKAAGFKPTLIERAPALRTGGYVIDFWGLGYDIAERMGLEGNINRVGYHVREMRIVDDRGKRVTGFGTKVFGGSD